MTTNDNHNISIGLISVLLVIVGIFHLLMKSQLTMYYAASNADGKRKCNLYM